MFSRDLSTLYSKSGARQRRFSRRNLKCCTRRPPRSARSLTPTYISRARTTLTFLHNRQICPRIYCRNHIWIVRNSTVICHCVRGSRWTNMCGVQTSVVKPQYDASTCAAEIQRRCSVALQGAGHDIVVRSETGSGKTLAFLLPLLSLLDYPPAIFPEDLMVFPPTTLPHSPALSCSVFIRIAVPWKTWKWEREREQEKESGIDESVVQSNTVGKEV